MLSPPSIPVTYDNTSLFFPIHPLNTEQLTNPPTNKPDALVFVPVLGIALPSSLPGALKQLTSFSPPAGKPSCQLQPSYKQLEPPRFSPSQSSGLGGNLHHKWSIHGTLVIDL